MKKYLKLWLLMLVPLCLTACSVSSTKKDTSDRLKTHQTAKKPKFQDPVTLYFHGLMGSYKNERPIVEAAKKAGVTNSVIRANVNDQGKVKLIGKIKKNAKNSIVMVTYKDNVQPNFSRNGTYASNVVKTLQKKYDIRKVNMIGYSLGNVSIIYYQLQNGNRQKMPRLVKQVNIAGHFNGAYFKELPPGFREPKGMKIDKNGKPNKMNATYKQMLKVRPIYEKHPVQVLNVIGDVGNGGDGVVKNISSQSLKYLVAGKNYQELKITGVKSDHGSLPNNDQVEAAVVKFLWK
ncbi:MULTISPECIES: alpha/beta hydrolase [Lactobacillus]|nr:MULTISPECIES: alpha/beta hydrolase [Lactobacillus]